MSKTSAPHTPPARRTVVRPRDSAAVIVLRRGAAHPEVLIGRRPGGSRFMPNVYVFPGGAVERDDGRAGSASELDSAAIPFMGVAGDPGHARRLAMAAVRETFEETGLMLAEPGRVGFRGETWGRFDVLGMAPALGRLEFVGRAITPPHSSIRFHTRFFHADAASLRGELAGNGELLDLQWIPLPDVSSLPVADVTRFMLAHTIKLLKAPDQIPGRPVFSYSARALRVRYL